MVTSELNIDKVYDFMENKFINVTDLKEDEYERHMNYVTNPQPEFDKYVEEKK